MCEFSCMVSRKPGAFYRDVPGLAMKFNFLKDGTIIGFCLAAGGRSHVEVFSRSEAAFSETGAINHLCLDVENIGATIAHIRARSAEITDRKMGCDDTWQAWTKDPGGVKIELFEYTGKSAQFVGLDRIANW